MPDYNDQPVKPLDNLHHVEGLISISDRVARRKEEQKRRQQNKDKKKDQQQDNEDNNENEPEDIVKSEDGHIDFRA